MWSNKGLVLVVMGILYFDDQWLQMEKYKKWIIRGVNNTSVKCQVCPIPRINIEISNQSGESPSTVSSAATHFKKLDSFFVLEAVSDTEIK